MTIVAILLANTLTRLHLFMYLPSTSTDEDLMQKDEHISA